MLSNGFPFEKEGRGGASIAPTSSLCAHHFKDMSIGLIFGYVSISHHLGGTLGSFVPGVLYDLTGSYTSSFLISIVLLTGSGLISPNYLRQQIPDL